MNVEHLNALMFNAEGQQDHPDYDGVDWQHFLNAVLADEFEIRRSAADKPLEGRDAFLEATRNAEPRARAIVPGSMRVWESASLAAVECVIEVEGRTEHFFQ